MVVFASPQPASVQPALGAPRLLHEYFERQAAASPGNLALECGEAALTYGALNRQANRIAHWLRARGLGPGKLVALYFNKTPGLFACLLGALKAGAGYVPIDPKFPLERVLNILEDAGIALVLTEPALAHRFGARAAAPVLDIEEQAGELSLLPDTTLTADESGVAPSDLCYAIFTSGSTGRPKGVMIEHRNAVNFVKSLQTVYGVTGDDRVYQGFSIAFDAAVEEVWAAWSVGGALVVASEDVARSPLDAAEFLNGRRISFFSTVPTFLAMIKQDLPAVRLLVVGGEACPAGLVSRWAKGGRRMLNTYGPTEATVVATWCELAAGKPVTIGKPLPGYYACVLDECMRPVQPGEPGELYIGGAGVGRGYINRPELNGERFIADPFAPAGDTAARLYRTFDHVRAAPDGELEFLGRLDGQIKIRGFRVELAEIEAVLLEHRGVRAAAAGVAGGEEHKEIAAYIVPAGGPDSIRRGEIAELLQKRLPEYMVPKYLDILDELPVMTSGKVDRKNLPSPKVLLKAGERRCAPPQTSLEKLIAGVWEESLKTPSISAEDDFFLDLGGHSLLAAHVVTALRSKLNNSAISVRDLYQYRTVRELARHLEIVHASINKAGCGLFEPSRRETSRDVFRQQSPWTRLACVSLQAIAIYCYYAIICAPFVLVLLTIRSVSSGQIAIQQAIWYVTALSFLTWPALLCFSIALKWLVIGRYRPGRYPLWGWYYFRWWLVNQLQSLAWPEVFAGSPLLILYYRLMGAKIGKHCHIGTPVCPAFDLISIGDETSIGAETQMLGYRVEDGMLVLGTIGIGSRCFVGMHCSLGLNTRMGDDARLDDLSQLADGEAMEPGGQRRGSPARPGPVPLPEPPHDRVKRRRPFLSGFIHLLLIYAMGYFLILTLLPGLALIGFALLYGGRLWGIAAAFAAVPLSMAWYTFCLIAVKWLFIRRVRPGLHPVGGAAYMRHWFLDYLLNNTREILLPLYATIYFPSFLRLLGAKIGKNAEISTVQHVTPDLLEIGEGSFCADAALIGGKRIHRGWMEVRANRIGKRSFIGNSALVPGGIDIGDDCLVGVMSTPPSDAKSANGARWLGSPGFPLPRTQKDIVFDAARTFCPTRKLLALRALIDAARILLPGLLMAAGMIVFTLCLLAAYATLSFEVFLAVTPPIAAALSIAGVMIAALVKRALAGTFTPTIKPLYSPFVWMNELVNGVYETVAAPALAPLMGTPFIAPPLRWMGCKIGKWVYLETTLFSEFDLVEIGDYSALNLGSTVQTHLFEDRVMKTAGLRIGENCTIGNMAIVLYGTEMRHGAWLGPLSVLMKGETLPAFSRWLGIPTQPYMGAVATAEFLDAAQQDYPAKVITLVAPFAPGGG